MGLIFQDSFVEAVDTDLDDHVPDIGTSWLLLWQTSAADKLGIVAANDNIRQYGASNSGSAYLAEAVYDSADYAVEWLVTSLAASGSSSHHVLARVADIDNLYACRIRGPAGGAGGASIWKKVAGGWTVLGATFTNPAVGQVLKFDLTDDTLTVYYDGVEQASRVDGAISAAGKAGLLSAGGAESSATGDDPSNVILLDDFKVTTAGAGLTAVGIARTVLWNVAATVGASRTLLFNIAARVAVTRTTLWNVLARVGMSRSTLWNLRARVAVARTVLFDVLAALAAVGVSRTLLWNIRSKVDAARTVRWDVRSRVAAARTLVYNVSARVALTRVVLWNVTIPVAAARAVLWAMRSSVGFARTLVWNVVSGAQPRIQELRGKSDTIIELRGRNDQ